MTPTDSILVILALCGVISTLAGLLYKTQIDERKHQMERIVQLEKREDEILDKVADQLVILTGSLGTAMDIIKEVRTILGMGRKGGGGP